MQILISFMNQQILNFYSALDMSIGGNSIQIRKKTQQHRLFFGPFFGATKLSPSPFNSRKIPDENLPSLNPMHSNAPTANIT